MRRLALILPAAVEGLGATQQLRRFRLQAVWEEAVGELLAHMAEPTTIKGDILFVRTAGASWSQEVQLRQFDILARLRKLVDTPVKSIRCRVGRLSHDLPPQVAERVKRVEWDHYRIPLDRQEAVEAIVAELQEPTQADRVRRFLLQLERRRLWAIEQGWRSCRMCGHFHPEVEELCPGCRLERLRQRREKLLRLLGRRPWATHQDLLQHFADLTGREYFQARLKLRSLWTEYSRNGMRELPAGAPLPAGIRERLLDLCMVATGVPFQSLQRKHVVYALGKVIGEAYLTNRNPGKTEVEKANWGRRRSYSSLNQRRKTLGSPAAGRKPSLD